MQGKSNYDYWQETMNQPLPSYQKMFDEEKEYLRKHVSKKDAFLLEVGCGCGRSLQYILDIT
jgi:hypothetical protein